MVIIFLGVVLAYFLLYELPKYFIQFYEPYTEKLVSAYIIFDYVVLGLCLQA